jgi:ankyrin repeat protein
MLLLSRHIHTYIHTYIHIQDGNTALNVAAFKGHTQVVEVLLNAGASADIPNMVRDIHIYTHIHTWSQCKHSQYGA